MSVEACSQPGGVELLTPVGEGSETKRLTAPAPVGPVREVWALAWPAIGHMLLITLVFMADRALVGRYASSALASMQISTTLSWTVLSLLTAFSIGTLALVARLNGAGDRRLAATAARASLALALVLGLVTVGPLWLACQWLVPVLFPAVAPAVMHQAIAYLDIVLPVLPIAFLAAVAVACFQAGGDTRTPLIGAAIANLINLVASSVLIFGLFGLPEMGVRGAAVGSVLAFVAEAIFLALVLRSKGSPVPLCLGARHGQAATLDAHLRMLRRLVRVSLPALGEKLVYHAGYLGFVAIIGLLGATAMAANQALISIEALSYQTAEGFGIAAGTLAAQKLGAGKDGEASRSSSIAARLAMGALATFATAFVLVPELLMRGFGSDPAIIELGVETLYVAAAAQPVMAFAVVSSMTLRGAGATRTALGLTLLCSVGVRLAATWLLAIELEMGLVGVWLGSAVDWLVHAVLLVVVLERGRWRKAVV
ncbi:MAG: MATE family efflux transporter [Deltaproteobacteria bacterium]|nr:MATE family efflux transporter [Deltaproteobacteria bacterium]